jgi:hypothetical protein
MGMWNVGLISERPLEESEENQTKSQNNVIITS